MVIEHSLSAMQGLSILSVLSYLTTTTKKNLQGGLHALLQSEQQVQVLHKVVVCHTARTPEIPSHSVSWQTPYIPHSFYKVYGLVLVLKQNADLIFLRLQSLCTRK